MNVSSETRDAPQTWPSLAIGLCDKLTGRGAEITYAFDNVEGAIPSGTGGSASPASWKVNGTLRIRTKDGAHS